MSQKFIVEHSLRLVCEGGLCGGRKPTALTFGGRTEEEAVKVATAHGWLVAIKRVLCPYCRSVTPKPFDLKTKPIEGPFSRMSRDGRLLAPDYPRPSLEDAGLSAAAQLIFQMTELYQHKPEALRALDDVRGAILERAGRDPKEQGSAALLGPPPYSETASPLAGEKGRDVK
jgi:hypothetical protein